MIPKVEISNRNCPHMSEPRYWMDETSGELRSAIEAFLSGGPMKDVQIAVLRAYLRQWIYAPVWRGPAIPNLQRRIANLTNVIAIRAWIKDALAEGLDPL